MGGGNFTNGLHLKKQSVTYKEIQMVTEKKK